MIIFYFCIDNEKNQLDSNHIHVLYDCASGGEDYL